MANFRWDDQRREAAQLIAEGNLSFEAIARKLSVSSRWIFEWRQDAEFQAYVNEITEDYKQAVRRRGIAVLERRVAAQNDRWLRLQQLIEARANDPAMQDVPGGTTGTLVRQYKQLGQGPSAITVEEYVFDAAVFKELREIEKHASQELGQWTEKKELSGPEGGPLAVNSTSVVDPNTLAQTVVILSRIESDQAAKSREDTGETPVVPA
jgi:hypothetical protein